jgi:uncharacterized membrane protein YeaQ/YmgE (transglycosylase-associated protein family)
MNVMLLFSLTEKIAYYQTHVNELLITLFIGAVAGMLAQFLVGARGLWMVGSIIVGIIGAWLGDMLFGKYLNFTHNQLIDQIIRATAGAILIVVLLRILFGLRPKDKSDWKA